MLELGQENPHQPHVVTWTILNTHADVIYATWKTVPSGTWFPLLKVDLARIFSTTRGSDGFYKGKNFYVCPGHNREGTQKQVCGGPDQFFCASWDCISTGDITWDPPVKNDLISVTRAKDSPNCKIPKRRVTSIVPCNPILIRFTDEGKKYQKWNQGVTWGLRVYADGYDAGGVFSIKMSLKNVQPPINIGPNLVLNQYTNMSNEETNVSIDSPGHQLNAQNPLWALIDASFHVINATSPNLTVACWLCHKIQPPYYEGIAVLGQYTVTPSDKQCRWKRGTQTLQSITGQGICIGQVPKQYQQYCNYTDPAIKSGHYYVPPEGNWWACDSGLTACAYGGVLNQTGFCILVQVFPRIYIHSDTEFYMLYPRKGLLRHKREPVSAVAITLGTVLGVAGVATGVSSLVTQHSYYNSLRVAIDEDLERVESAISHLQKSLTSLSEVVLQNRRGLDLLFLQEGGLCVALKEECCFFADHSGIVQDSMAKLKEGLEKRKRERQQSQGWFEALYAKSPWLTTLVSTIMGPMIILLLLLTFGPCIVNKLVAFVRNQVGSVQMMVMRQQYAVLSRSDNEEAEYDEVSATPQIEVQGETLSFRRPETEVGEEPEYVEVTDPPVETSYVHTAV